MATLDPIGLKRRGAGLARLALGLAAALAPGAAGAQFRATPMVLPVPVLLDPRWDVLATPFTAGAAGPELLLLERQVSPAPLALRHHEDLATRVPSPFAQPPSFDPARAGRLSENGSDALGDVVYWVHGSGMRVAFGDAPGTLRSYASTCASHSSPPQPVKFELAHVLNRTADLFVQPCDTGLWSWPGTLVAVDLDGSASPPSQTWSVAGITARLTPEEVLTMRIGSAARTLGVDDLYVPGIGSLLLFENAGTSALGPGSLLAGVKIGGSSYESGGVRPPWLPAGINAWDCQGAAPLDVDADGILDLVVSLSYTVVYVGAPHGHLLWIRGTGSIGGFSSANAPPPPWHDLNPNGDLGLVDPVVLRGIVLPGNVPAAAIWDRGRAEVLVATSAGSPERFAVWHGATGGRQVRDIRLVDLVGSSAPDLVVDATSDPSAPAVLVFPDLGDASPRIAWAGGSPGTPSRGEDHAMQVLASDADSPFRVDWFVGDPWAAAPRVAADQGASWTLPGTDLCGAPPQSVAITVRAVDGMGVWDEVAATLDVVETPPAIAIAAAVPPDRLALPPGGTQAEFVGTAWSRCPVSLAWGTTAWPSTATVAIDGSVPGVTRQTVVLPESAYPDLLAGPAPAVSLTATDPALPAPQTVTMAVAIDATGLARIAHEADVPTLAEGEVAVLRTRLRSEIGLALPGARVVDLLDGLAPAGPPRATGATIVESRADGAEVVLDALPAAGSEVVIELPVRSSGPRHASAVEVRSQGGHLLTPPASVAPAPSALPGCGCGSSPPCGAACALLLLALARPSRGRAARGRPGLT